MIFQIPMVLADEYKHVAFGPCRVLSVHGFNNNGTDRYLQFHTEFPDELANGDVPNFKSLWFPSGAATVFGRETFGEGGLSFSELLAAVSSTEVNYTAVTNTGLDITIVVETDYPVTAGTTIGGDLTTANAEEEIWSSANGPKKLLRLDVVMGADASPVIQARSTALNASYKTKTLELLSNGESKSFFFGPEGGQIEESVGGTTYRGCLIGFVEASPGTNFLPNPIVISTNVANAFRYVYEDA